MENIQLDFKKDDRSYLSECSIIYNNIKIGSIKYRKEIKSDGNFTKIIIRSIFIKKRERREGYATRALEKFINYFSMTEYKIEVINIVNPKIEQLLKNVGFNKKEEKYIISE